MRTLGSHSIVAWLTAVVAVVMTQSAAAQQAADRGQPPPEVSARKLVRIAAAQTKRRMVDWHIGDRAGLLKAVEKNLSHLERIVDEAGQQGCDVLVFPEDTLGLLNWYGMNEQLGKDVLPKAVARMLDRLGRAAAKHRMYLVVCSDFVEFDGGTYNTAFLLGRDGKQIGRYHKTCPT